VPVEHSTAAGEIRALLVWLVDWDDSATSNRLNVHQYTVVEAGKNRRVDVVVFLNGLPVTSTRSALTVSLSSPSSTPTALMCHRLTGYS